MRSSTRTFLHSFWIIFLFIFFLVILGGGIFFLTRPASTYKSPNSSHSHSNYGPIPVIASPIKIQDMPVIIQTFGTLESAESVTVLPQTTGTIQSINFQEGDFVKQDQLLITIDPSTSNANLQQAEALLEHDQAQLETLAADKERFSTLLKQGYASQQQYEQAVAADNSQIASVAADQEQVNQAKIQLSYTQIKAPISGKTGNLNVKVGDLVTANSSDPLLIINQLDPVLVDFAIPESQFLEFKEAQKAAFPNSLNVEIFPNGSEQSQQKPQIGKLIFVDNNVNPDTGTIALKASFTNPSGNLLPGETLKVRLILRIQPNAIVIPESAVQIDQNGNFVYLVNNNTAQIQRISIARTLDHLAIVSTGLTSANNNQMVLTTIPSNLNNGDKVKIQN